MTPQYIAALVACIVPALQPLVAAIEAMSKTPANVSAEINTAMTEIESLATSLTTAPTVSAAAPILQQIQAYAQEILSAASSMPLPFPASMYLQIGSSVVMMAFSMVNTILASQTPPVASVHMTVKHAGRMAVYDPALTNRLPEWLGELIRTTGLTNAAAFLKAQIPVVPGYLPQLYAYYLTIMTAVRGPTGSGEIGVMAIGISHIGETF